MLWPISDLARVYADMQNSIASAERAFSLVDARPEVVDRPGAIEPRTRSSGEIEFEHVDFYYEAGKPVLNDFNLKVQPGETIALVGPTGGGKSTIVNLVCRFYEPKARRDPHRRARLHRALAAQHPIAHRRRVADPAPVLR